MFPESNKQVSEPERIESLRLILEREQSRSVTYAEALEVAESLISFYEILVDETYPSQEALVPSTV